MPKEGTDEGALARLLIVEVGAQPRDPGSVKEAMGLMKVVLENRLKNPADFYARGATTLTQVIKAHRASPQSVQFAGFQHYPNLASLQQEALDLDLKKASNMDSSFDPVRYLFATAVAVAKAPTPADPSSGGLYFWKTHPTPLGQPGYKLFRTVAGIDFFQKVVEPKKVDHHEKHATTGPMTYSHGRPDRHGSDPTQPRNGPMIYSHGRPDTNKTAVSPSPNGPMIYPNKRPGPR